MEVQDLLAWSEMHSRAVAAATVSLVGTAWVKNVEIKVVPRITVTTVLQDGHGRDRESVYAMEERLIDLFPHVFFSFHTKWDGGHSWDGESEDE